MSFRKCTFYSPWDPAPGSPAHVGKLVSRAWTRIALPCRSFSVHIARGGRGCSDLHNASGRQINIIEAPQTILGGIMRSVV